MTEPASTPSKEERINAKEEPMKVYHMDFDLEAKSIVESWVLSPNSAKNTNIKAVIIDFNIKNLLQKL